jgi:hypothetical protein
VNREPQAVVFQRRLVKFAAVPQWAGNDRVALEFELVQSSIQARNHGM